MPSSTSLRDKLLAPAAVTAAIGALYLLADRVDAVDPGDEGRRVLLAALLVSAGILAVRLLSHGLLAAVIRRRSGREAPALLVMVMSLLGYSMVFVLVYGYWLERDLGGILATSAVVTVVIGLALQDTLGNFFAGVSLHFEQQFSLGDTIRVGDTLGRVASISWRTTSVRTHDDTLIVFPNNGIAREPIEVFALDRPNRRVVLFPAPLEVPPQEIIGAVRRAVEGLAGVYREPAPVVRVRDLSGSRVTYELLYWVRDYMRASAIDTEALQRVWYVYARAGIPAPYPTRSLRLQRRGGDPEPSVDRADLVAGIELFEPLSADERDILVAALESRVFAPGEHIIRQDAPGDSMFVVAHGGAEVRVRDRSRTGRSVATLGPGDFFGEMALFTGEPRTADVVAVGETEVLEIRQPVIRRLLEQNEDLAVALSATIAARQAELAALDGDDRAETAPPDTVLRRIRRLFRIF